MFPVTICIEVICLLIAIIFLRNTVEKPWTGISWFLVLTVVVESLLAILGKGYHVQNTWLVNIYTFLNFTVINWIIYLLSPNQKYNRTLFRATALLFAGCFFFEILFKGFFNYTVISNLLSDALLFIMCSRYFYLLLKEDSWIDIHRHAAFWFVTGTFLFNLCVIAADLFDKQLTSLYIFSDIPMYYLLYLVFDLILYGCWSFAFICKYQETI